MHSSATGAGSKARSVDRAVSWNACAAVHHPNAPMPQASRLLQDCLLTCMASQAHQSCSSILISLWHVQQRSRQLQQRPTWHEWEEGMVLLILVAARGNAFKKDSVPDQQAWGSCTMATSVSGCSSAFISVKQLLRDDQEGSATCFAQKCLPDCCIQLYGGRLRYHSLGPTNHWRA